MINDVRLFKHYDITTNFRQAGLGSITEDTEKFSGLEVYIFNEKGKSCYNISSAPIRTAEVYRL